MKIAGKKIAIVFYPNTRSKPHLITFKGVVKKVYQLYVSITYDSMHTQFRADYPNVFLPEEDFEYENVRVQDDPKTYAALEDYKKFIYHVVEFEVEQNKDRFKLAGLGKRLRIYSSSVPKFVGRILLDELFIAEQSLLKTKDDYKEFDPYSPDSFVRKLKNIDEDISVFDLLSNKYSKSIKTQLNGDTLDLAKKLLALLVKIRLE